MTSTAKLIQVVDDEPTIRMLFRACLEKDGFQVVEADNGKSAMLQFEGLNPMLFCWMW